MDELIEETGLEEVVEEKVIEPKLGDVFKYSDYMPYLEFAQANGYQIIDYSVEGEEKLFMVREMPVIEPTDEELQIRVRSVRNRYLEKYIDPKQLVLVWDSLSIDERNIYAEYRKYLLDYTESDDWWLKNPMTLDEWLLVGTDEVVVSETENTEEEEPIEKIEELEE